MYSLINTVTLFLRDRYIRRGYLILLFLCLILLCSALVLIHQGDLHHWHGLFADDTQTPWDGGDGPSGT